MRRKAMTSGPKRKAIGLKFADPKRNAALYELVNAARQQFHGELETAKICCFWITVAKPDINGNVPTGKAKLASGSVRAAAGYDLELHLNQHTWELMRDNAEWKESEIDRLLCFFATAKDKEGSDRRDDEDRKVFRIVRPDVVCHREHLRRYKPDDVTMLGLRAAVECDQTRDDLFSSINVKAGPRNVTALPNWRNKDAAASAAV